MIEIIEKIRQVGGIVAMVGADLVVRAPAGLLTAADKAVLVEHRDEVVRLLAHQGDRHAVQDAGDRADRIVRSGFIMAIDEETDRLWEESVDPPAPCQQCGSLMLWWDILGGTHCMICEPATRAEQLMEHVQSLLHSCRRSRYNKRSRQGVMIPNRLLTTTQT